MEHHLKIWPEYFEAVAIGNKTFELRKDDRNFMPGDNIYLQEYNPRKKEYTGRTLFVNVTYVINNCPQFGLEKGYALMSIKVVK